MRHAFPANRVRPTAMALVLLAHVPLVLLFLWGWRLSRDEPEPALIFIGLWPTIRDEPKVDAPPSPQQAPQRTARRSDAPEREAPASQSPVESSAITVPSESTTPSESPPSVDWRAEGAAAAARQAAAAAPSGFSAPPKVARKACEPPKSSWEWNPEPKKAGLTPLPYIVLGRCVVGLGLFGCALQKPPEANSHLLDDMRDGKTSPSSVPDPAICD